MSLSQHMLTHFDHDNYGEIINGPSTYDSIVKGLGKGRSVIIGWTDQEFTHLDIIFAIHPITAGSLQRGMRATDLFVSVSGFGMFGFDIDTKLLHPGYVGEKLGLGNTPSATTVPLAELIGQVRSRLV